MNTRYNSNEHKQVNERYNKTLFQKKALQFMGFTVIDIWKCKWEELKSIDITAKTAGRHSGVPPLLKHKRGGGGG